MTAPEAGDTPDDKAVDFDPGDTDPGVTDRSEVDRSEVDRSEVDQVAADQVAADQTGTEQTGPDLADAGSDEESGDFVKQRRAAREMVDRAEKRTRAFVIHPEIRADADRRSPEPALHEALALAEAMPGLTVVAGQIVKLPRIHPGTLFGKGKIEELGAAMKAADVELALIDGHVGPVQQRNLEEAWGVKILDRTGLILEIFSDRARTREGVLQVEMAALSYQRTRLVRAWTHLERQRGGMGFVGGPGETQRESDRRAIDMQLLSLKRQLAKVAKTRTLHRAARAKVPYPIVALVGYTNAGKSTLFNRLTGADVLAKDMLFATLDPTMRELDLPGGLKIILSDTVGFISALPTELVAAFRATLEEVLEADLILHVRDISHPETIPQMEEVKTILTSLDVDPDVPVIEVWNKIDLLEADARDALIAEAPRRDAALPVSSVTGAGLDGLVALIEGELAPQTRDDTLLLGWAEGRALAWLQGQHVVQDTRDTENGWQVDVRWSDEQAGRFHVERARG